MPRKFLLQINIDDFPEALVKPPVYPEFPFTFMVAVCMPYPAYKMMRLGPFPHMVRLYITLDIFANRQVDGLDTIFRLSGGGRLSLGFTGDDDEAMVHASPVFTGV